MLPVLYQANIVRIGCLFANGYE